MIKSDLYLQVFIRTKIISMQSFLNTVLQKHRRDLLALGKGSWKSRVVRNSEMRNIGIKNYKKVIYKWLYIEQMNFQVHIHFPQTFQMYFWTISSSSGVFKMMNLNRPSEFSALNFCFDPNDTLCSILNWNLLKYFLEHEFIERHQTYQMLRVKHLVLIAEFAIICNFPKK